MLSPNSCTDNRCFYHVFTKKSNLSACVLLGMWEQCATGTESKEEGVASAEQRSSLLFSSSRHQLSAGAECEKSQNPDSDRHFQQAPQASFSTTTALLDGLSVDEGRPQRSSQIRGRRRTHRDGSGGRMSPLRNRHPRPRALRHLRRRRAHQEIRPQNRGLPENSGS
jgi:hypothetical protein